MLCKRCALRCSQSGSRRVRAGARRSCAAAERGHPWPRTCAPFPAGLLRYSARTRAVARGAGRQSSSSGSAIHPDRSEAAARMAASWGPCRSAGGWRISPQGRAHDARVFFASTRMCCRKTPQAERELAGQDARRATGPGWPSLWLLSLGHSRESDSGRPQVGLKALLGSRTRLPQWSRRPKGATKRFALRRQVGNATRQPPAAYTETTAHP